MLKRFYAMLAKFGAGRPVEVNEKPVAEKFHEESRKESQFAQERARQAQETARQRQREQEKPEEVTVEVPNEDDLPMAA